MAERLWVIRNRATGHVVTMGRSQTNLRRLLPVWREFYAQHLPRTPVLLKVERGSLVEVARSAGAV